MSNKKLTWTENIVKGDEIIPYDTLSEAEKDAVGLTVRKAGINAVANAKGCDVEFHDTPTGTVTA